jgi:hypothetical protein
MKWDFCNKDSYLVSQIEKEKALNFEKELIKNNSTRK